MAENCTARKGWYPSCASKYCKNSWKTSIKLDFPTVGIKIDPDLNAASDFNALVADSSVTFKIVSPNELTSFEAPRTDEFFIVPFALSFWAIILFSFSLT